MPYCQQNCVHTPQEALQGTTENGIRQGPLSKPTPLRHCYLSCSRQLLYIPIIEGGGCKHSPNRHCEAGLLLGPEGHTDAPGSSMRRCGCMSELYWWGRDETDNHGVLSHAAHLFGFVKRTLQPVCVCDAQAIFSNAQTACFSSLLSQ